MEQLIQSLQKHFGSVRYALEDEKQLQLRIADNLSRIEYTFKREHRLDTKNIVDFLFDCGLAMEVKIGGNSRKSIFHQCERYCQFEEVKAILLLTNKCMSLPESINGKSTCVINLSEAWL